MTEAEAWSAMVKAHDRAIREKTEESAAALMAAVKAYRAVVKR
jgi:hypothetical protein